MHAFAKLLFFFVCSSHILFSTALPARPTAAPTALNVNDTNNHIVITAIIDEIQASYTDWLQLDNKMGFRGMLVTLRQARMALVFIDQHRFLHEIAARPVFQFASILPAIVNFNNPQE